MSMADSADPSNDKLETSSSKPKYLYTNFVSEISDESSATEKLKAACRNIEFLQTEHATTLHGLHEEIEKLQEHVRELQFSKEVLEIIAPENDFFNCDIATLQQKVDDLIQDNEEMKKKLQESNRALEILDQKQKLERWQHQQELEDKEKTILRLQKELEVKCSTVAELAAQLTRKKKSNFLRRFSFNYSDTPSASSIVDTIQSLRCADVDVDSQQACSASARSLPTHDSPSHSINCDQSSYSSLSDKSTSDDEILRSPFLRKQYTFPSPKYGYRQKWWGQQSENVFRLPPIPGLSPKRPLVRQQIRVDKIATKALSDPFAIDKVSLPELIEKR